jgi:Tfp pilus assembly protein PilZ
VNREGNCIIQNISVGGTFVETEGTFEAGTLIQLKILSPLNIEIEGKVVWKRGSTNLQKLPSGIGLRFAGLKQETEKVLVNYIFKQTRQGN